MKVETHSYGGEDLGYDGDELFGKRQNIPEPHCLHQKDEAKNKTAHGFVVIIWNNARVFLGEGLLAPCKPWIRGNYVIILIIMTLHLHPLFKRGRVRDTKNSQEMCTEFSNKWLHCESDAFSRCLQAHHLARGSPRVRSRRTDLISPLRPEKWHAI